MITFHTTIHDSLVTLFCNTLFSNLGIDPVGESPMLRVYGAKFHGATSVVGDSLLKRRVEVFIIQENVWVMIPPIEMSFNRLDGLNNTIQLLIPRQHYERGFGSRLRRIGPFASRHKHLIMLLANSPTQSRHVSGHCKRQTHSAAYLIAGGAPAGINMPTPDLGCRTNSTRINTTTIHGNNKTTPRGIEMLELPLNLSGRRKNASLILVFDLDVFPSSAVGRFGAEGRRFITLCTNPIAAVFPNRSWVKRLL